MLKTLVKLAVALIIHDMIFLLNLVQGETNYSKEPKVERKTFMNETYVERVLFKAESQNLSEIDNISPKNSSEIDKVPRQLHSKQKNSSGNDNEIVRKLNNEPENVSAIHNVSRQLKGELKKPYEIDNVSRQPTSKPKNSFEINNVTIQSNSDDEAEKIIISAYNMNIKRKIKSKLSQSTLDFMAVVKQNAQYPPMTNKCRLRIVGGKRSSRGDVPYQVCFRRSTLGGSQWSMFCGGSILTRTHVLSAAHCFKTINYRVTRVIAGTTTSSVRFHRSRVLRDRELKRLQRIEVWRTIKKCHKHRDYDNKKTVNDIAVVELRRPLVFTEFVKPIPMITRSVSAGVNCLCSGYGHMGQGRASDHLQMVCFPIIQDAFCKRLFAIYRGKPTQLCAGTKNKDSCNGDSGGPLVCDGMLAGIVSYGSAKCGTVPGVYTLVSGYTSGKAIPFQTCHAVQLNFNAVEILLAWAFIELHVLILFLST